MFTYTCLNNQFNMVGAALGIAGLGMSLYNQSQSAAANRRAKRYLENQKRTLNDYLYGELSKNYMDSNEGQSAIKSVRENITKNNRSAENSAAASGGTDESKLAAKEVNAKAYGDTIANIATMADQRKAGLRSQLIGASGAYDSQIAGFDKDKAEQMSTAAGNAMSTASSAIAADGKGVFNKYDDKINKLFGWGRFNKTSPGYDPSYKE